LEELSDWKRAQFIVKRSEELFRRFFSK